MGKTTLSLDDFKEKVKTDNEFKSIVSNRSDVIDIDHGFMLVHVENLNWYLEQYLCKNQQDLEDTLWYNHGVFLKVVE